MKVIVLRCFKCDWGYTVAEDVAGYTAREHLEVCDGPILDQYGRRYGFCSDGKEEGAAK